MSNNFDIECYRLAGHFLDDVKCATEPDRKDLASAIQQCIEDWLKERKSEIADGRKLSLGYYHTPEEAHSAYCVAAPAYHREFARTK